MMSIVKASLVAALLGMGVTAVSAQPPVPQLAGMRVKSDNVVQVDNKNHKK